MSGSSEKERMVFELPKGACDAHCHVFGPAKSYPVAPDAAYTPEDAPVESLQGLHRRFGFEQAVLVQGGCYGSDHSCLLDALKKGGGAYRGVATVTPVSSEAEIDRLDAAGCRAARFSFTAHLGGGPEPGTVRETANRLAERGWHIDIHCDGGRLESLAEMFAALPTNVVIDHMARLDARLGPRQPQFRLLQELADLPHVWVKVSGIDRTAPQENYHAAVELAHILAARSPDRTLWGTDWPHPNSVYGRPDDGELVRLLWEIAPDSAMRARLLAVNPQRLYFAEEA